jgi:hypothetical protein
MKIYSEDSIRNFEFWGGARDTIEDLTYDDFDILETREGIIFAAENEPGEFTFS